MKQLLKNLNSHQSIVGKNKQKQNISLILCCEIYKITLKTSAKWQHLWVLRVRWINQDIFISQSLFEYLLVLVVATLILPWEAHKSWKLQLTNSTCCIVFPVFFHHISCDDSNDFNTGTKTMIKAFTQTYFLMDLHTVVAFSDAFSHWLSATDYKVIDEVLVI